MRSGAAIIIATMKPPARIVSYRRRLFLALVSCPVVALAADVADQSCRIQVVEDPRLVELRAADPDDPHINITSDQGDMSRAGDAELSGNVSIQMGQRLLAADKATVDAEKRSIAVQGNVEYLDPTIHVTGRDGQFADGAGNFEGAKFELVDGSGRGAAKNARLHDETVLDLERVRYTACPPGNDDWEIKAQKISLDQESSTGTARDVRLDFKGVPIMYSPWLSFPVGDQRKSGLLFPAFGSGGKNGTQVMVPWYWNIAPNYDATFTSRWYSARGFRIDPEFRYLTERSHGVLEAQYLPHDEELDKSRGYYYFKERDAVRAAHAFPRQRVVRHRRLVFRGLWRRLREHQHHLPEPARGNPSRHRALVDAGAHAELPGDRQPAR